MIEKTNKILVVDDETLNCRMLKELFEEPYTVTTASSGEEALALLPTYEPDLLLLDIMLPGMNGYDTCRAIRNDTCHKFVKIVMMSVNIDLQERLLGYEAGADDYIAKPFDFEELKHKVRIFLHLKRIEEVDLVTGYLLRKFSLEARTLLSGLIFPAEYLLQNDLPKDEVKLFAGIIFESSNRLAAFARKVTLFCELKKGLAPVTETGSLNAHLQTIIHNHADRISHRSITIDLNASDDTPLFIDWELFECAIGYILENAIEHSPLGGTVAITMAREPDLIRMTIADQGKGIQPELIDKIFDGCKCLNHLARLDDCKGFSLAIARRIIGLHHGTLTAYNNPAKGASFYITLPVTRLAP